MFRVSVVGFRKLESRIKFSAIAEMCIPLAFYMLSLKNGGGLDPGGFGCWTACLNGSDDNLGAGIESSGIESALRPDALGSMTQCKVDVGKALRVDGKR